MRMFDDTLLCDKKGCINQKINKKYCRECQNNINTISKLKRLEKKDRGICKQCPVKRMKATSYCLYHYMKRLAVKTAHDASLGILLYKKYLDQHKQCFYSGVPIELGINASIDHVHCQSKYNDWKSNIDNMVWTTRSLNSAKTDLELNEFLRMCELVTLNSEKIREMYVKY